MAKSEQMIATHSPSAPVNGPQAKQPLTFTVFTPTFNRAAMLHRAYDSLCCQTFRDFEWLVVDDGSTDGTGRLVSMWQEHANFPIRYVWQRNLGKHVAFNCAVKLARGELFLTLDSDDACVPTALEEFHRVWLSIPEEQRHNFSAVTALSVDQTGRAVGDPFPADVLDSDSLELRYRFKVRGDKWGFQRTSVLREFPFPVIDRETFVPESVIWDAISRRYKTRFVNLPLHRCWVRKRGSFDPGARSSSPRTHACGLAHWHRFRLNEEMDWFWKSPFQFLRSAVHYVRFSLHSRKGLKRQFEDLQGLAARLMWAVALPIGCLLFGRDRCFF